MKTFLKTRPTAAVPPVTPGLQPSASRFIAEWQRGPETLSGYASRKLRLALAPAVPTTLARALAAGAGGLTIEPGT